MIRMQKHGGHGLLPAWRKATNWEVLSGLWHSRVIHDADDTVDSSHILSLWAQKRAWKDCWRKTLIPTLPHHDAM